MNYYLGLDIGIGSIGWAVMNLDKIRIEDFGVRLFDTGEDQRKNERYSQQRRRYRGIRRLYRRRSHRKQRLKNYLNLIGLITEPQLNTYFETHENNVIKLRYNGLSEKLSPEELAACLIHICNNRGYKDFYDINIDEIDDPKERKEYEEEHKALNHINQLMKDEGYRTPAEMIYKNAEFNALNSVYRNYHNSTFSEQHNLIARNMLEREVDLILWQQSNYYKCLDKSTISNIKNIIFAQRDFETGPGNENDKYRKFTGYLDTLGKCRFYKDKDRGCRFTVIADIYSFVNTLSQYNYVGADNNIALTSELANEIIDTALSNGSLNKRELNIIAKKYSISINDNNSDTPITKCFKYIKTIKPIFEKYGYSWNELIENYTDTENNLLNKVGIILSQSQTPKRRIAKLKAISPQIDDSLINELAMQKFSGTTNVSYEYMVGSINAFCEGDIYGKFQAKFNKEIPSVDESSKPSKLPPFKDEDDCEFFKNPVVFRAINETRKVINAIICKYGYPNAVNIETADEVNKTFEDRNRDTARNRKNEKENDRIINEIIELTNYSPEKARSYIEKYKLWEAQEGKCLYSGTPIEKTDLLNDTAHLYEVDHIIPYSLILDNTLNNKALVLTAENQRKSQRTPLMYMESEKADAFRKRVNVMLKSKKCSKKKYQYLMLENLNDSELLSEWKSRNLNDTRYICKYLVNYLRSNLRFNTTNETDDIIQIKNNSRVYAVKSKFTSMFRRQWLNEATWGKQDKQDLKKITYLDHAVDAIVIANLRPEYVILAGEKQKLSRMYFQADKKITPEYEKSKKECIDSLYRYYGMSKKISEKLLCSHSSRLTPMIPGLCDEVDKRLWDKNIFKQFWNLDNFTDEEIEEKCEDIFKANVLSYYKTDPEFARALGMPVVSYKPDHKYRGKVTDDNAISIKEIDGKMMQLSKKAVNSLTSKDIENIYTDDSALIEKLKSVLKDNDDKYTVSDYLSENDLPYFTDTTGRRINKVTVKSSAPTRWLTKQITDTNYTQMNDRSYYCIELYKDKDGANHLLGITMSDIVHKNGKLWLRPDYEYPSDYSKHKMYIFTGDYIRVTTNKGKLKFEGYYKSVKTISRNQIYCISNNNPNSIIPSITKKDKCIKLSVDILGKTSGYNNGEGIKCGEPLSLLREKN